MDQNLKGLITEFQVRVREALALIYRSGIQMPIQFVRMVKS